jgi:hypothetical protein
MNNLCMPFYGWHTTDINTEIKNALPKFLISNIEQGPWGGTQNYSPAEFQAVGISDFCYIDVGYGVSVSQITVEAQQHLADTYGCYGVFFDQCPSYPTAGDKVWLAAYQAHAAGLGLKTCYNTGLANCDLTYYLSTLGADYMMCQEQYNQEAATSLQQTFEGKIWVLTEYTTPATAAQAIIRTEAAWATHITYHFACESSYTTLPSYLTDYVAGLSTGGGGGSGSITKSVVAEADDGYGDAADIYTGGANTWWEAGHYTGTTDYKAWFRFTVLGIPSGATITSTYLSNVLSQWDTNTHLKIMAFDTAAPAAPTTAAELATAIAGATTAKVDWDSGTGDNTRQNGPDIKTIIQELVNSYSGLATCLILVTDDTSDADASAIGAVFENTGYAPALIVNWADPQTFTPQTASVTYTMYAPVITGTSTAGIYVWERTA